ncbi:MAG: hypothetical protein AAFS10_22770, partial [Myxococcota bacterium]
MNTWAINRRRALMRWFMVVVVVVLGVFSGEAKAQGTPEADVKQDAEHLLAFDLEIDPLAYALGGHSLHAGIWW